MRAPIPSHFGILRPEPMRQLVEARVEDDDWTGTADKAVRRKRQNRLNQRAYRRRRIKPGEQTQRHPSVSTTPLVVLPGKPYALGSLPQDMAVPELLAPDCSPHHLLLHQNHQAPPCPKDTPLIVLPEEPRALYSLPQDVAVPVLQAPDCSLHHLSLHRHHQSPPYPAEGAIRGIPYPLPISLDPSLDIGLPRASPTRTFGPLALYSSTSSNRSSASRPSSSNSTTATSLDHFPLSCDYLLTLVQFNVLRALLTNISLLHLTSTFFPSPSAPPGLPPPPSLVPPSLRPTPLQLSTPHLPWIDIFPHPVVRDNLIRAGSAINDQDVCTDIVGAVCGGRGAGEVLGMEWNPSIVVVRATDEGGWRDEELRGVLVWADPWDASNWELTEGFLRKWGWTLRGATDLIDASNKWREKRGEDRLVVEL